MQSFGWVPKYSTAGPDGSSIFSFWGTSTVVMWFMALPTEYKGQSFTVSSPACIDGFLDDSHFDWSEVASQGNFNLHFPDVEHVFRYLLGKHTQSLVHVLMGMFDFGRFLHILVFSHKLIHSRQRFLPHLVGSFSLLTVPFAVQKVLISWNPLPRFGGLLLVLLEFFSDNSHIYLEIFYSCFSLVVSKLYILTFDL